jgi:transaldolase
LGGPPGRRPTAHGGLPTGIETNPPAANALIQESGRTFARAVDRMPSADVLAEIDAKVDMDEREAVLMAEGVKKFADPQKALLALIARRRS